MAWVFGNIDFADYNIYVSKSSGLLDLPKLNFDPTDWLDADGLDYWQEDTQYEGHDIYLSCFMIAGKTETKSGYEVFIERLSDFYDELKSQGFVTFLTPYISLDNCSLTEGVQITRHTNYNADTQVGTFSLKISVEGDSKYLSVPVYDWATFLVKSYLVVNNLVIDRQLQGESSASCSYETKDVPDFHIWDYIVINTNGISAEPYYFLHQPDVTKESTNKYKVSVRLEHGSILLKQATLLNNLSEAVFDIYANLDEIVDMIIAGGNRFVGSTKFVKGTIETTVNKLHKFSCENCYDLLKRLCSEYELEYDVRWSTGAKYTIDVKQKIASDKSITLEYGKGNGLYELSRGTPNKDELVSVLYAFGSNKNLPMDYRGGKDRLEFTGNPIRLNEAENMAIEKSVLWDDIFPEREGTVTEYYYKAFEDCTPKEKQTFPNGIYRVQDTSLGNAEDHPTLPGFDLNDQLLDGAVAKISMLDGDCAGITFDVQIYEHDPNYYMFIIPYELVKGKLYPNETSPIAAGDKYVFVDINMPDSYVTAAETRLYDKAVDYITEKSVLKYPYTVKIHPAFSDAIVGARFEVGDRIVIIDSDLGLNDYQRISSFRYDVYKRTYDLTLFDTPIFSFRNGVKMELENMNRIFKSTDADKVVTMRQNQETTLSLKNRMLNPIDEQQNVDQTVRNESIDPRMLGYDAGVPMWLVKGVIIEPSYEGDENKLRITNGEIFITNDPLKTKNRYDISKDRAAYDPNRVWSIESYEFDLDTGHEYFLYARLPLEDGVTVGTLELSETFFQVKRYIEDGYICYPVAFINTAASPRVVSALWGNVRQVNAASINAMIDPRLLTGGRPLYLHQQDSDITDYKKLLFDEPDEAFQEYDCFTDFYEGEKLLKEFSTDPGFTSVIRSGAWIFSIWAKASNNDDSSDLLVYVLKRDGDGVETELFNFEVPVNAIVPTCYQKVVMHTQEGITATDRIVVRFKHRCVSALGKTLYVYCEGDTDGEWWWSNVRIPVDVQFGGGIDTDELVKYDSEDPTAGYLSEKVVAGDNITIEEGTGADENKLKISASGAAIGGSISNVKYGYLYNWYAVTDARNLAAAGWHVPTVDDFETLKAELGGAYEAGGKIKETGLEHWDTPNTGATNETGFTSRGAGRRDFNDGAFKAKNTEGAMWCLDEVDQYDTSYLSATMGHTVGYNEKDGASVRLVKDDSVIGSYTGNNGKTYPTVKIGDQVWMAANLMETKYRNGDAISGPTFTNAAWIALTTEAYCIYADDPDNAGDNTLNIEHNRTKGKQGGSIELDEFYHHTKEEIEDHVYEAPEDGGHYVRKDGAWVEVPSQVMFNEITFEFCVIAGTAQTFKIDRSASFAYTITKVKLESDGTLEGVHVKIGSTAVTGLNDMDVSTMQSFTATAENGVEENDVVSIVTTATYSGTPTVLAGKLIFEV